MSVFVDQGMEQGNEPRIRIRGIRLTQHFAEHVDDPSTFGINEDIVSVGRFRGRKARTHSKRTNIGRSDVLIGAFRDQALAIAIEP